MASRLDRLVPPEMRPPLSSINLEEASKAYIDHLIVTIERYGRILNYPEVLHRDVVTRELARKRPFRRDGTGYRDFLIWQTIRQQMLSGTERLIFITDNVTDFGSGPSVHEDLKRDLINSEHLVLVRTLREFNEEYISPRRNKFALELPTNVALDVVRWVSDNLLTMLDQDNLGEVILGFPKKTGNVQAAEIISLNECKIAAYEALGEVHILRLQVETEIGFSVTLDWVDFLGSEEVRNFVQEPSGYSTYLGQHSADLTITVELIIDATGGQVESHDVLSIDVH